MASSTTTTTNNSSNDDSSNKDDGSATDSAATSAFALQQLSKWDQLMKKMGADGEEWDQMMAQYSEWKQTRSYSPITTRDNTYLDDLPPPELALWVCYQRSNKGDLKKYQEKRFSDFNAVDDFEDGDRNTKINYDYNLAKLLVFRDLFGHTHVPVRWEKDTSFGKWVSRQRLAEKKKGLKPDRKAALEALGFKWSFTDAEKWELKEQHKKQHLVSIPHEKKKPQAMEHLTQQDELEDPLFNEDTACAPNYQHPRVSDQKEDSRSRTSTTPVQSQHGSHLTVNGNKKNQRGSSMDLNDNRKKLARLDERNTQDVSAWHQQFELAPHQNLDRDTLLRENQDLLQENNQLLRENRQLHHRVAQLELQARLAAANPMSSLGEQSKKLDP